MYTHSSGLNRHGLGFKIPRLNHFSMTVDGRLGVEGRGEGGGP